MYGEERGKDNAPLSNVTMAIKLRDLSFILHIARSR